MHQRARFTGDLDFWKKRLSPEPDHDVRTVFDGDAIRFRLYTNEDFAAFEQAIAGELKTVD